MKLVTDGQKWAIKRKPWFGPAKYYCFVAIGFWWTKSSRYFGGCWADKETAEKWFKRLTS